MLMECVAVLGTWWAFGLLILLCVLLFGYLVPKVKAPIFMGADGRVARKVLDEYFPSWTPLLAERFFAGIGAEGRAAYRRFYWVMDFWFPGAVASLASASLLLIVFPVGSGWAWLCVLAVPAWVFDMAENITHFRMARAYPKLSLVALRVGPWFTGAKWMFAILPLVVALVGFVMSWLHAR